MPTATDSSSPSGATLASRLSRPSFVVPFLFAASAILIWANWNSPFYNYDDADHLQQATETTLASRFSTERDFTFFPVSDLSMRIDRVLFGPPMSERYFASEEEGGAPLDVAKFKSQVLWAAASRVENALWHALAGVLLWFFLRRIGASPGLAFLTAAAWTAHPMACESVCWISERKNVLSAFFGFGALLAWTGTRGAWWRWPLVSLMYLLSTLSKPAAVGLLPIIAALEIIQPPDGWPARPNIALIAARLAAPTLITGLIIWAVMKMHQTQFVEHAGGSLFNALLTDLEIFARYVGNTLLPLNLSFFYGIEAITSLGDWRVWVYGAALFLPLIGLIWITRGVERRLAILGIVWFFAAQGPAANIVPIAYWMQDRYVYYASAGLLLAYACGASSVLRRLGAQVWTPRLGALFLTMLIALSASRSPLFADSDLLSFDAASRFPNSCFAQVNAYAAARFRIERLSALSGDAPAKARAFYIQEASTYYDRAIKNKDLTKHREEFKFRVDHAELMLETGAFDRALECLNGFLPPAHLKLRDPRQKFLATEFKSFYAPQTLARAWLVDAQVRLSQSNPPGVPLSKLPLKRRFELCDEAAAALNKSMAIFDMNGQAPFLLAAVDLTRAELVKFDAHAGEMDKHLNSARARLKAIPVESGFYQTAQQLLQSMDVHSGVHK